MNEYEREEEWNGTERRRSRSGVPFHSGPDGERGESPESPSSDPFGPADDAHPESDEALLFDDEDPRMDGEDDPFDVSKLDFGFDGDDALTDERLGDESIGPDSRGGNHGVSIPRLGAGRGQQAKGRRLVKNAKPPQMTPEQRILVLDAWKRSGLPAGDFAPLVGVSKHTLYGWKKRFEELGPAGLMDQPRGGPKGSRLPDLTKRAILMMKEANPEWGCQRISDMLARGPALPASPATVAKALHEAGYQLEESPTRPHAPKVQRFERARANQLWQTDLFTFILKRQNRRVYLVAFMDDYSRFIVSYGLHASQSAPLVLEVLRAGITAYGTPEELLSDNGAQYVTWRGKSAFARELEKRGVKHIVASPRRPQTLGKIERFWGTLWRECIETSVFLDLEDARRRIGHFVDYYNFQRAHQGIDGLVPADRFFGAAPEVLRALKERVAANALQLARHGVPKQPFYIAGQMGGTPFSLHAEGEKVILSKDGVRQEVDMAAAPPKTPGSPPNAAPAMPVAVCPDGSPIPEEAVGLTRSEPVAPGASPLDEGLRQLQQAFTIPAAPSAPEGGQS